MSLEAPLWYGPTHGVGPSTDAAIGVAAMIELHSQPTPNGQKVMLMLEETGLAWVHVDVDIRRGEQFSPAHLKLSPNNKIPAIIDTEGPGGGPYAMMESGAILIYLADKTGRFLPKDGRPRYDALQWLMFQMAHVGPMFGQANHFNSRDGGAYAKERYNNEAKRLFRVIENRLLESEWLAGPDYTIADMATYPWTKIHKSLGIEKSDLPGFSRWFDAISARPACERMNAMVRDIRERMDQNAKGKPEVDLYDMKAHERRLAETQGKQ
jgi:GST-like protein